MCGPWLGKASNEINAADHAFALVHAEDEFVFVRLPLGEHCVDALRICVAS